MKNSLHIAHYTSLTKYRLEISVSIRYGMACKWSIQASKVSKVSTLPYSFSWEEGTRGD